MINEYSFSPSELDYKAKKCPRCFYSFITKLIDLLEQPKAPDFSSECNFCNFTKKQIELKE